MNSGLQQWSAADLADLTRGRLCLSPGADPAAPLCLTGVSTDSRSAAAGNLYLALRGQHHDGHDFIDAALRADCAALIVDRTPEAPTVPAIVVADTRRALAALAAAHRASLPDLTVIGITGTAGKSTTKDLLHAVLSRAAPACASPRSFNNDIGVPLTILAARPEHRFLIAEVGTNAPGEIAPLAALLRPDIAIITSIGRGHLEGLGSVEGVAREKSALLHALPPQGLAIIPDSAPALTPCLPARCRLIRFGFSDVADLRITRCAIDASGTHFTLADGSSFTIPLPGRHQAANAAAVIAAARAAGMSDAEIAEGLNTARSGSMRFEPLAIPAGDGMIRVINDAYNANPESMLASLTTFADLTAEADNRVLILADMLEMGDAADAVHAELARTITGLHRRTPLRLVILIGASTARTAEVLSAAREFAPPWRHLPALDDDAADAVAGWLQPGDSVLLKGSRSMGLERLIPSLRNRAQREATA